MKLKFYFILILYSAFTAVALFASGKSEDASISVLTSNWDDEFTSHPAQTIRDAVPDGSRLFFCCFSPLYSDREDEQQKQFEDFLRQLSWYNAVSVRGELLDYAQGANTFSRWYDVKIAELAPASAPEGWKLEKTVSDSSGSAARISIPGTLQADAALYQKLKKVREPSDYFDIIAEDPGYRIAVGIALRHSGRHLSWLASDKAALLELAASSDASMRVKSELKHSTLNARRNSSRRGSLMKLDTTVRGFYVLHRWFDKKYFYTVAVCRNTNSGAENE